MPPYPVDDMLEIYAILAFAFLALTVLARLIKPQIKG